MSVMYRYKRILSMSALLIAALALFGGLTAAKADASAGAMSRSIVYRDTQYGFDFNLPKEWKGYTVVRGQWAGTPIGEAGAAEKGPELSIRSPKWTSEKPTQDIPVMIFTLKQWEDLLQEKFAVSAAPIPPSELGRNSKYVFALPPRYNFAFPAGWEEVEDILKGKPLTPTEKFR